MSSIDDKQKIVLDTSIIMSWLLPDESHPISNHVQDLIKTSKAEVFVPELLKLEVTNVLVMAQHRNRLTKTQSNQIFELFLKLMGTFTVIDQDIRDIFRKARQHQLSTYDASYVSVAVSERADLKTLDKRLKSVWDRVKA